MREKAGKTAFTGMLAALALALSVLEGLLPPLPMMPPGARLGLSNIVTMYAAGSVGLPCALLLALLKGGFAFLTRGITPGIMSLTGGLLSALCMWLLFSRTKASLAIVGVCGALAHNGAQLFIAYALTGAAVAFYIPFLIIFGALTGLLTGTVLKLTIPPLTALQGYLGKGGKV